MDLHEILGQKVSFQAAAWKPLSDELTIESTLEGIRSEKYAEVTKWLRGYIQKGDLEDYDILKKRLPAVTFCGLFAEERKRELLKSYTQLVVLDIDDLEPVELAKVKHNLDIDPYSFAFWESPSRKGIKGLVYINYTFELNPKVIDDAHRSAFVKLSAYYAETYNIALDKSGSDTTRLCFLSYDRSLILKSGFTPFVVSEISPESDKLNRGILRTAAKNKSDALNNPTGKNKVQDRALMRLIINYLKKNKISITHSYHDWYRVAYAIANSFTYDVGIQYFIALSQLDITKYNETECINLLTYSYETTKSKITFNTIVYYAKQKGFKVLGG